MLQRLSIFVMTTMALAPAYAQSSAELAELRRQVEMLSATVHQLQQQVNQQRLAPVFTTAPSPGTHATPAHDAHFEDHHEAPARASASGFHFGVNVALDAIGSYSRRPDNLNFIVRDAELIFEAEVDNFARAFLTLNAGTELEPAERLDAFEDAEVRIEEAAIETTALPWGLQVKAGQFFADFTRSGPVHSHDLPFVDRPPSIERIVGGETRARGVELSWNPAFAPQLRLIGGVVDDIGAERSITSQFAGLDEEAEESAVFRRSDRRSLGHLLSYGRAETSFELKPNLELQLGANYARGRVEGTRQMAGGDFLLAWKPRPESEDRLELSGEYLWARSHGGFSDDVAFPFDRTGGSARAHGGNISARYRFGRGWEPGVRFDFLSADTWEASDGDLDGEADGLQRRRGVLRTYSAFLTYYLGEANRLRLQANYQEGDALEFASARDDWQLFLQWTLEFGTARHHDEH